MAKPKNTKFTEKKDVINIADNSMFRYTPSILKSLYS